MDNVEYHEQLVESFMDELGEDIARMLVEKVVVLGWRPPQGSFIEQWRKIPGYDYWEMSNGNMVRHVLSKECVPITYIQGDPITITIHDNFGVDVKVFLMELTERTWPKGLIGLSLEEASGLFNEPGELVPVVEWKLIPDLPSGNFEISNTGLVRHRKTERLMVADYDIDYNHYMVKLIINGKDYRIIPELLVKHLWPNQ